jgi:NADH:ubiquinone oxidoreductase subunit C
VDAAALLARAESIAPVRSTILEKARFGRGGTACLWLEMKGVEKLAAALKGDPELILDFLENLSVFQLDDALVVTYFLRSRTHGHSLVLRGSVVPAKPESEVEVPSVASVWSESRAQEAENEALFGITFGEKVTRTAEIPWKGFPLRKNFIVGRGTQS